MPKKLLVDEIEGQFASRAEAERSVDAVVGALQSVIQRGDVVSLKGFGSFTKKRVAERIGRNPRTGEAVKIAARDKIAFKPSKLL